MLCAIGCNNAVAVAWTWDLIVDHRLFADTSMSLGSVSKSVRFLYSNFFTILLSISSQYSQSCVKRNSVLRQLCIKSRYDWRKPFVGRIVYTEINVNFPERVRMLTRFHVARNATLRGNLACRRRSDAHLRSALVPSPFSSMLQVSTQ